MDGGDSAVISGADEEKEPGFAKKILLIPCMTKSLMNGITAGIGVGLGHFLFTSNVSRATNYGLGGYVVVLFGTWAACRYELAQARAKYIQVQNSLQSREGNANIKLLDPKDV